MKQWTQEHAEIAQRMGWDLFAIDGNPNHLEIQKLDEAEDIVFISDEHAQNFVRLMAETDHENNPEVDTCKLAMEYLALQSDKE